MTGRCPPSADDGALTVLYDGACPLCRREVAHYRDLAAQAGDTVALTFSDVSRPETPLPADRSRADLLRRFHVRLADGRLVDGAAAFVALWARLPGWRWLAAIARVPGVTPLLEVAYRAFLPLRPTLQRWARRAAHEPPAGD